MTCSGVPLWLAAPVELPAVVRLRVPEPAPDRVVRVELEGAHFETHETLREATGADAPSSAVTLELEPARFQHGWAEIRLVMKTWTARARVEQVREG